MSKSEQLRLGDVSAVFHLVGECRELELNFPAWQRHLLAGLCGLTGARLGLGGAMRWAGPDRLMVPVQCVDFGFTQADHAKFEVWLREPDLYKSTAMCRFHQLPGRRVTRARQQLVSDREHYGSFMYNEVLKPGDVDHGMLSRHALSDPALVHEVVLNRAVGEPPFGRRERRLMRLFHREIEPQLDRVFSLLRLAPRLRQTLAALLEGDSEKEVALRLGLSVPTVHEYVTALYRHFDVCSRAELLAYFLRRARGQHPPGQ